MDEANNIFDNAPLKEAIKNVTENENAATQHKMIEELLKAKFLTPIEVPVEPDKDGSIFLNKGAEINLNVINSRKGEQYLLAFTDWEELNKWQNIENQQTMLVSFNDLAKMLLENGDSDCKGFVINPFGENVTFNKRNIIAIIEAQENMKEKNKKITVRLGEPRVYPTEMINSVINYLKTDKRVNKAYLQMMLKGNRPGYLIAVDCDGDKNDVYNKIGKVAVEYLENGLSLDVAPLDGDYKEMLINKVKPFYEKK